MNVAKTQPPTYRPEIDGLRSIAVISVVIFHAQFAYQGAPVLGGGFIGVDVFFVISGYLITSIILRELKEQTFTVRRFYERRARRILPALFTVMLVSLPFSWLFMLPKAVKEYAGSMLSSLAFGSNIWFWLEDDYWAEPSELKPLLHTWSLSVEEQFYVVFPILLLAVWNVGRRYISAILLLGLLASLWLADSGSRTHAEATFYLPFARGWELLAGAILAHIEITRGRDSHPFLNVVMPALGVLLIISSFVSFDSQTPHPSIYTAFPVVGTMLLLWFCKPGGLVSNLLSSSPMVGIGLISYSFYLWHFPIFALARIRQPDPSQLEMLGWIVLALVLSVASYRLVEKPFRNRQAVSLRLFLPALVGISLTIVTIAGHAYLNNGLWGRYSDAQLQMLGIGEDRTVFDEYVHELLRSTRGNTRFSDSSDHNDLLIIGDSYSGDVLNALESGGFLDGLEVLSHYISADCHNVSAAADYEGYIAPENKTKCASAVRAGDPELSGRLADAELVLFASSWREYATSEMAKLLTTVQAETTAEILIIGRKHFGRPNVRSLVSLRPDELRSLRLAHAPHLKQIALVPAGIGPHYLDLHQLFCGDNTSCPIATPEGHLISYDGGHLTPQGAAHLATLLLEDDAFLTTWQDAFSVKPPNKRSPD